VTYECSLDGADFTPCADPVTFSGLSKGEHTLAVRSRDSAGNVDPTPATISWNVTDADKDFLGDGVGCASTAGGPSALTMMGLALLAVLGARRRQR
jgi:MYXO-CTERM domain-containing protein